MGRLSSYNKRESLRSLRFARNKCFDSFRFIHFVFAFPYSFLFVQYINDIRSYDMRQLGFLKGAIVDVITTAGERERGKRQCVPLGAERCPNMATADASAFFFTPPLTPSTLGRQMKFASRNTRPFSCTVSHTVDRSERELVRTWLTKKFIQK